MATRIDLHNKLVELLGNNHVYYQAPENLKMEYPCIRYSRSRPDVKHANNIKYIKKDCYEIIVIDKRPDNVIIEKILELPLSMYDRHYTSDNLNHDVITLYF